ncbi:MAG: transcriptional repressor [Proteobacteria bacterium]|nr:transcriptional repressor [Pseudomonadota bacterium]
MIETLRETGHRLTPQRLAVLKVLSLSEGHPSAEQVYEQVKDDFPTTSLATIYKTINLLKSVDQVLELGFAHASSRYDGNKPYPHPHVICTRCGRVVDPEHTAMRELSRDVAIDTGFRITHHRLDFYGLCPDCQEAD